MEKESAWTKGYNDYWNGIEGNPFQEGTEQYSDWQDGWNEARAEDNLDTGPLPF